MTKEEIKNADLKDLGLRYINLCIQEDIDNTESYNLFFNHLFRLIDFKDYRLNCKKYYKSIGRSYKERRSIIKLRPSVKGYIKFILERVKSNFSNIIVTPYPGIYLKEYIIENQLYAEDFADDLGISETQLFLILNGKARITEELAVKLSEVMGTSKEVWINLQKSYDESNKLINEVGGDK